MENETTPTPELYTGTPGDMGGAPAPELINEMPPGSSTPELYMDDMETMQDYMEMQGMPMDDDFYYDSTMDGSGLAVFAGMMMFWMVFMFGILILMIVSMWKIFTKAGEQGWKSIIPFYNTWVMFEISGKPGWWMLLLFIPFVNFIFIIILYYNLSKVFGKGIGYTLGLLFLSPIFFPMLAFGNARYVGSDVNTSNDNAQSQPAPQQPSQPQDNSQDSSSEV